MTNITEKVWEILSENSHIVRCMGSGLINTNALARYIINEKKVDATLDAVNSAIRRYEFDKNDTTFSNAYKLLNQAVNISTKSNLAEIALIKDTETQCVLPELFKIISYVQGDILRIMQANKSVRLLIDEKNFEKTINLFPKDKIISKEKDLAEINIYIHPQMQRARGILALITNELAVNGINIVELMTCTPEMLCVIKIEDLSKASNILHQLCKPNRKAKL